MRAIEASSSQISQIIGVIDEIAFQTNLLALNAGVEAARAGDAGRGFAVVASAGRALAQRSAGAAKEIKTLISTSGGHVEAGVDLVDQSGEALEKILARVDAVSRLVSQIAASGQEQSSALAQVNSAVNQMDQITQQNAAMVEQSTAASRSLAEEADALAALVARFRLAPSSATRFRAA
jgi:methyl-accepting chemotaxis protein